MAFAILSDIHGNLEALTAIFKFLEKKKISEVYCLGDIVGYGPNPNECIEIISTKCTNAIIGNHDHAALGLTSIEYFNEFAKVSTRWTMKQLNNKSKDFLLSLDFKYGTDDFLLVHASPSEPRAWNYILTEYDARLEFKYFQQPVCFIGHSHFPIVFSKKGYSRKSKVKLDELNRYIVNVGSTGQPRDGDSRACFCIYDLEHKKLEYVRIEYDIQTTREKIIEAGLPMFLADRLKKGF